MNVTAQEGLKANWISINKLGMKILVIVACLLSPMWAANLALAWTFSGDVMSVTVDGSVTCSLTFAKGRARGAACSDATKAIAAKMLSATTM